jgi:hypothetical protein
MPEEQKQEMLSQIQIHVLVGRWRPFAAAPLCADVQRSDLH